MQPATIVLTLRLSVSDPAARRELAALVGPIGTHPGCLRCELMVDPTERDSITLVEEWATRADLDRHFRAEECRRLLALLELADAPPELHVDSVALREGIEAIASARGQPMDVPAAATAREK